MPAEAPAGWFLYHIDLWGDRSAASRQLFFQTVMRLFLQGGLFVISSPIEFYIDVNKGLGFTEVPDAIHWDYGKDYPSKTLVLDVRGEKLQEYLKNMMKSGGVSLEPEVAEGLFALTDREREVANMLLVCSTNAEIALRLHVTEITVKKHLGRIYNKASVRNKAEFLKKLMSME